MASCVRILEGDVYDDGIRGAAIAVWKVLGVTGDGALSVTGLPQINDPHPSSNGSVVWKRRKSRSDNDLTHWVEIHYRWPTYGQINTGITSHTYQRTETIGIPIFTSLSSTRSGEADLVSLRLMPYERDGLVRSEQRRVEYETALRWLENNSGKIITLNTGPGSASIYRIMQSGAVRSSSGDTVTLRLYRSSPIPAFPAGTFMGQDIALPALGALDVYDFPSVESIASGDSSPIVSVMTAEERYGLAERPAWL